MTTQKRAEQEAAARYPIFDYQNSYRKDVQKSKQEAFIAGYTADKWIEVVKGCEMPEADKDDPAKSIDVNVTLPDNPYGLIAVGHYVYEKQQWFDNNFKAISPTAYQPLPKPYKKG